ncbi:MAG: MFS transporter, partial [Actinobacteria bacterium]
MAAVLVAAVGTLFWGSTPAAAAPNMPNQCSIKEWQDPGQFNHCVGQLKDLTTDEAQCVVAPPPEAPDSGMAGWFAS